jgi:hypothetical protein
MHPRTSLMAWRWPRSKRSTRTGMRSQARVGSPLAGLALLLALAIVAPPAHAAGDWGPNTCLDGYVWREATPADLVCVTGAVRSQAASDNRQAAARRSPTGGAFGPDTCVSGYVWREAVADDHVCVTVATRSRTRAENARGPAQRNSLNVWHSTYAVPPRCDGGETCSITSTDDIGRFRLRADHLNVGWVNVQLRRTANNALRRSWRVYAGPAGYMPGARLTLDTGVFNCRRAPDSYFRVQDPSSTRWSARHLVSSICKVL